MAQVKLPDGSTKEVANGTTVEELARQIGAGLARAAIAARIDEQLVDLSVPITADVSVQIITSKDKESLEIMRHSCAHVMAEAKCSRLP